MLAITLNSDLHFLRRSWQDESVVHVIDSGQTHLLSAAGTFLLERLQAGPVPFDVLLDELALISEDLPREEIVQLLNGIISDLNKIGLLKTVEIPS